MADTEIHISALSISDKAFSFDVPTEEVSPDGLGRIGLRIDTQVRFAAPEEALTLRLDIRTFYLRPVPEAPAEEVRLLRYVGEMEFQVLGGGQHFRDPDESDEFLLPRDLVVSLLATAYATFRGVIHAKLGSSEMNNIVLPLLDVDHFFKPSGEYIRPERA